MTLTKKKKTVAAYSLPPRPAAAPATATPSLVSTQATPPPRATEDGMDSNATTCDDDMLEEMPKRLKKSLFSLLVAFA